jgi:hypothetical protein
MLSKVLSASVIGIDAFQIEVEGTYRHADFLTFQITVNLTPSYLKKKGSPPFAISLNKP